MRWELTITKMEDSHKTTFNQDCGEVAGMYSLTLVKMAASRTLASIMMRSSAKVKESHMVAI